MRHWASPAVRSNTIVATNLHARHPVDLARRCRPSLGHLHLPPNPQSRARFPRRFRTDSRLGVRHPWAGIANRTAPSVPSWSAVMMLELFGPEPQPARRAAYEGESSRRHANSRAPIPHARSPAARRRTARTSPPAGSSEADYWRKTTRAIFFLRRRAGGALFVPRRTRLHFDSLAILPGHP